MKEKQIQNEAQYRNATLKIAQQKEGREQQDQPLNTELLKSKIESENALAKQRNGENSKLTGVGAEIESLEKIKNKYGENSYQYKLAQRAFESTVSGRESLATSRENPNRFASAQQKDLNAFESQIKKDNPGMDDNQIRQTANAYLNNQNEINGQKLPEISGEANALRQSIFKRNSTAALQNQAANMNNTISEMNSIDITPLKKFAGLKGTLEFKKQQFDPSKRTEDWYAYDAFKNSTQIYAMDTLRKGFGTSVVPGYVYETLGRMANPVDPIWGDPQQVETRWKKTLELINKSAKNTSRQAQRGATAQLENDNKNNNVSSGTLVMHKKNEKTGKIEYFDIPQDAESQKLAKERGLKLVD